MRKLVTFCLLLLALAACSEKESPAACDYQRNWDEFSRKVDAWAANPSAAKCEEMRTSAIELLQRIRGCPGAANVQQALESWKDVDCSPFDL